MRECDIMSYEYYFFLFEWVIVDDCVNRNLEIEKLLYFDECTAHA